VSIGPIEGTLLEDDKERVHHLMTIIDVKGISISDFTTDVIRFNYGFLTAIKVKTFFHTVSCRSHLRSLKHTIQLVFYLFNFIKTCTLSEYSIGTVKRLVLVNTPYWFSSVWGMIAK
jgi:hypothetical protein